MRFSFSTPDVGPLRVIPDRFGLSPHEDVQAWASPREGQFVAIEFRGKQQVARFRGRYVDLPDGTATWRYRFLGVLNFGLVRPA